MRIRAPGWPANEKWLDPSADRCSAFSDVLPCPAPCPVPGASGALRGGRATGWLTGATGGVTGANARRRDTSRVEHPRDPAITALEAPVSRRRRATTARSCRRSLRAVADACPALD